jgi:hypothetical protein
MRSSDFAFHGTAPKIMLLSSVSRVNAHRFFEHVGFRGDRKRGFIKYRSQFDEAA